MKKPTQFGRKCCSILLALSMSLLLLTSCSKPKPSIPNSAGSTDLVGDQSSDDPSNGTQGSENSSATTGSGTQKPLSGSTGSTNSSKPIPGKNAIQVLFGSSVKTDGLKVATPKGTSARTGVSAGKSYWQFLVGSESSAQSLDVTFEQAFLQDISKYDLLVTIEYMGSSSKSMLVSHTAKSGAVKKAGYCLGNYSGWTGRCVRITDFESNNKLGGAHLRLDIGDLTSLKVASITVKKAYRNTKTYPSVETCVLGNREKVVAEANVKYYGALGDGNTDDTYAFQSAITDVCVKGSGVVFVPSGVYKLTQTLEIPTGITLQGDFCASTKGVKGTVLAVYMTKDASHNSFIQMGQSSALRGVSVWYPYQKVTASSAVAYPSTISGDSMLVEDVCLVNSYEGIHMGDLSNSLETIRNVYGTPLKRGIYLNHNLDICRMESISFSTDYWANSGLKGAPSKTTLSQYTVGQGIGITLGRVDWCYLTDINLSGYKYGVNFIKTSYGATNGQMYRVNVHNCNNCIRVDYINEYSVMMTDCTFTANAGSNPVALYLSNTFDSSITCHTVMMSSTGKNAIQLNGTGSLLMQKCKISLSGSGQYAIDNSKGSLSLSEVSFSGSGQHIHMGSTAKYSTFSNCMSSSTLKLSNQAGQAMVKQTYNSKDETVALSSPVTSYNQVFRQCSGNQFISLGSKGIKQNADISVVLQSSIDAVASKGGGIVYIPYGNYRLEKPVTVKSGVEVRGSMNLPHHTYKLRTTLLTDYGKNQASGTALITLQANAGARGFAVQYDRYSKDSTAQVVPYSPAIRGNGKSIYISNITFVNAFCAIDLATFRCDNHYVESVGMGIIGSGIRIGAGSTGGVIRDVQTNIHYLSGNINTMNRYLSSYGEGFVTSNVSKQTMYNNFIFSAKHGLSLKSNSDVYCIGHGTDSGTMAVYAEGTNRTITLVNTQLVCLGSQTKFYVNMEKNFSGTLNMINTAMWGLPTTSVLVGNGTLNMMCGTNSMPGQLAFGLLSGKAVVGCFNVSGQAQQSILLGNGAKQFTIYGSRFKGNRVVTNQSSISLTGSDA